MVDMSHKGQLAEDDRAHGNLAFGLGTPRKRERAPLYFHALRKSFSRSLSYSETARHKMAVHRFPCLRRDALDASPQHRLREGVARSKPTEPTQHRGILHVERELVVPQARHPLDHDRSQHLI